MSAQAALHALRLAQGAPDPTPKPGTRTSTGAISPADLELARYLSLLENMELLQDLEALELLPILEDDDEP